VFVNEHYRFTIAFMIDSSGKMWMLSIQDDIAVLRPSSAGRVPFHRYDNLPGNTALGTA